MYSTTCILCRIGRWSFWSWFDANRSIFDEDRPMSSKRLSHFRSQWPWPWPLDLKFALLVTLVQDHALTNIEVSTAFLFWENRRHETDGQTERRTGANVQHDTWTKVLSLAKPRRKSGALYYQKQHLWQGSVNSWFSPRIVIIIVC